MYRQIRRLLPYKVLTLRPNDRTPLFLMLPIFVSTRDSLLIDKKRVKDGTMQIDVFKAAARRKKIEDDRAMHHGRPLLTPTNS